MTEEIVPQTVTVPVSVSDHPDQLDQIAVRIRQRVGRMLRDIYEIGKDLILAKALFSEHGQMKACLDWAANETGLKRSTLYNAIATAKAFQPFEEAESLVFLETIEARVLNVIASSKAPKSARDEFVTRVLKGEVFTELMVKGLVQEHCKTISAEADERFQKQVEKVKDWGELKRLEDPEEAFPLYLIDVDQQAHWFQHYKDLAEQYANWKLKRLKAQFDEVQVLIMPHWSIKLAPSRSQPERVIVESQIQECPRTLIAPSPASIVKWWEEEGQATTNRLLSQPDQSDTVASTVKLKKASCRDCRWHDAQHEGNQHGVWCGYFQDSIAADRVEAMPLHCNQYRNENNTDPLPPPRPTVHPKIQRPERSKASSVQREPQSASGEMPSPEELTLQFDLEVWLQKIEQVADEELDAIEQQIHQLNRAIARRKQRTFSYS